MQERLRDQLDRHPRAVTTGVIGGALVLSLLAVGLAFALFSGAPPTADVSPVPSASVSPSASSSVEASPAFTPAESGAPSFAGDALLQVSVDALRMRTAASTSVDIVQSLDRGDVVRVISGPVEADRYAWYEVIDLDSRSGWVALGDGADPWLDAVPADPATSELLLRLDRNCDVSGPTLALPEFTLTADGRVVLWPGLVRQLSPSGFAQVERDVLESSYLQASGEYRIERRPGAPEPPGHGACRNDFTLGEGTGRILVGATNWQGDAEEAAYNVPSPERRVLDELALQLIDVEAWLGSPGWSEPVARRYVGSSYLFRFGPPSSTPPSGVEAPSVTGSAWPFDGPIDQFGDPDEQGRCGYLDLGQAFEALRLMRELSVPTYGEDGQFSLDELEYGWFSTDAGWFDFTITPRSPDGYPSCAD